MARLFVAVWPDDRLRRRLEQVPRPDEDGVRWVRAEHWHVTIHFLGESHIDAVVARLTDSPLPATRLTFGPSIGRLGHRIIMIPATGAEELAVAVRTATAGIGDPSRRPFRGHLTLARTSPDAPSVTIGRPFDAMLDVDEVAVVESEPIPSGVGYRTVATFPTG